MASGTTFMDAARVDSGSRPTAPIAAIVLGLGILFFAGFAQPNTIHNAAHDTRHAVSVPCH